MAEIEQIKNTLPQNTDAETSLLGSLLLGGGSAANVIDRLKADDFYLSRHRILFEEIQSLWADEGVTDPVILITRLENKGLLDKVGGGEYVIDLTTKVRTSLNAPEYANIIQQTAQRRRLIESCQELEARARSGTGNVGDLIDEAGATVLQLAEDDGTGGIHEIKDSLNEGFALLDLWEKGDSGSVLTGFKDLDNMTNGLQPTDLVIVAGRPSMGKTTFALNVALNAAMRKERTPVLVFSLEMNHEQLALNMLSMRSGASATKMRKVELSSNEWDDLIQAGDDLSRAPIYIDDSPGLNVMTIRARARRLHSQNQLGMIVVDYLQLLEMGGRVENRQQEISKISRSLKQLARELSVPVVTISQLSRAVESRESHIPRMSDLRESGAIEQDADLIMLLYREEYYKPDKEEAKGLAEVIIAKQRKGPVGSVKLAFQADRLKFADPSFTQTNGPEAF
ncbi:MAG: replicative DNA helicase [Planctomycetota bacterium]